MPSNFSPEPTRNTTDFPSPTSSFATFSARISFAASTMPFEGSSPMTEEKWGRKAKVERPGPHPRSRTVRETSGEGEGAA